RPALHYVLFALPTVTSRQMSGAISFTPQAQRAPITLVLRHHRPDHSGNLVGERDGGNLRGSPCQQCREPGSMPAAMDLGIADDGERAGNEQAPEIAISLLADTAEPVLAPARVLLRHEPDPGRELRPDRKDFGSATVANKAVASAGPTPGQSSSRLLVSLDRCQALIMRSNSRICPLSLCN